MAAQQRARLCLRQQTLAHSSRCARLIAPPVMDTFPPALLCLHLCTSQTGFMLQAGPSGTPEPPSTGTPMDIVFVSAEVAPWSKTGGLGDVVGSLPIALARRGHRVMVVAPRHVLVLIPCCALL